MSNENQVNERRGNWKEKKDDGKNSFCDTVLGENLEPPTKEATNLRNEESITTDISSTRPTNRASPAEDTQNPKFSKFSSNSSSRNDNTKKQDSVTSISSASFISAASLKRAPFPQKLYSMLGRGEHEGFSDVVSWLPHGRAFTIHDSSQLVKTVFPKCFLQRRLASFQRQLKNYGFHKLVTGKDAGAYCHPMFIRNKKELHMEMTRTNIEAYGVDSELDFYSVTPLRTKHDIVAAITSSNPRIIDEIEEKYMSRKMPAQDLQISSMFQLSKSNNPTSLLSSSANTGSALEDIYSRMPKKPKISIPQSNHPLDQVPFFIPLNMLYE